MSHQTAHRSWRARTFFDKYNALTPFLSHWLLSIVTKRVEPISNDMRGKSPDTKVISITRKLHKAENLQESKKPLDCAD